MRIANKSSQLMTLEYLGRKTQSGRPPLIGHLGRGWQNTPMNIPNLTARMLRRKNGQV
jgi:hypothetical protein